MHHCFGVTAAAAGTAGMAEGIVEEGIVDEETIGVEMVEDISYGETGFLDGSSSTQETKKYVVLVVVSKWSRS